MVVMAKLHIRDIGFEEPHIIPGYCSKHQEQFRVGEIDGNTASTSLVEPHLIFSSLSACLL